VLPSQVATTSAKHGHGNDMLKALALSSLARMMFSITSTPMLWQQLYLRGSGEGGDGSMLVKRPKQCTQCLATAPPQNTATIYRCQPQHSRVHVGFSIRPQELVPAQTSARHLVLCSILTRPNLAPK
jgi:hypothetical protein